MPTLCTGGVSPLARNPGINFDHSSIQAYVWWERYCSCRSHRTDIRVLEVMACFPHQDGLANVQVSPAYEQDKLCVSTGSVAVARHTGTAGHALYQTDQPAEAP